MKVKLIKGRAASSKAISALENILGKRLPTEYVDFVNVNDGAEAETNILKINETNDLRVNRFIPVSKIPREMEKIENLPDGAFPFAWAEGGNYVILDLSAGGAVFFWDHEQPEDIVNVAGGIRSFLEALEPFDIGSVKLNPDDVIEVWVNPNFLKRIKDKTE